ncbi:MAG: DUF6977 family protein [Coprococcus sp.]
MAVKPVFAVDFYGRLYMNKETEFQSVTTSSKFRRKGNIQRLHDAFLEDYPYRNVLEISDYSSIPEGVMLCDAHLTFPMSDGREVSVAEAFQMAKLLTADGSEVTGFCFEGESFGLVPRNFFYNWLYIRGVSAHPELADELMTYDSFTDITFIPKKCSVCSAEAAAFYVALRRKGLLEEALRDRESFARILYQIEKNIKAEPILFKPGDRIIHPDFGEGKVMGIRERDGADVLEIMFAEGIKKLRENWVLDNCRGLGSVDIDLLRNKRHAFLNHESILAMRKDFEMGSKKRKNTVKVTSRRRSVMKRNEYQSLLDEVTNHLPDSSNDEDEKPGIDEMMKVWEESIRVKKEEEKREQKNSDTNTKPDPHREGMRLLQTFTLQAKKLQERLSECVYGQENAVSTFVSGYFQSQVTALSEPDRIKPRATFLFAGAPGVGKTFLAETAAKILGLPFARFDMSEYCDKEASLEFIGSDKVYKNGKEGNVTSYVKEHPHSVLLFDEVEKAHLTIIHLFLQMLDAGRLRDSYTDEEISFKDTIIILTTNAGRQLYEDSRERNLSGISRKTIIKALQLDVNPDTGAPRFPAAICSRFASGNVVMFNHMESYHLKQIVSEKLGKMARSMSETFGLTIEIDDDVSSALLFAEGGSTDARTVAGRAETFFNGELFELFRHLAAAEEISCMSCLEKVHFKVDIDRASSEVRNLFRPQQEQNVLIYADEQTLKQISKGTECCRIFTAVSKAGAEDILRQEEVDAVFVEPLMDKKRNIKQYLDMEDVPCEYMDFYNEIRKKVPGMPVYLLETEKTQLRREERVSFMRSGARDICDMTVQPVEDLISDVCGRLHQQRAMEELARYHQVVGYGSGQRISEDGRIAEISLIDLELKYAVDAGDSEKLLADAAIPDIRFDDIIGADDAKEELKFFADCLKYPRKYVRQGMQQPGGLLLYGPPGTGKTMLAKAMAAEADMTFITVEGGQFVKKYAGEGQQAVHDLFATARKYAPAIVFIDEIDAIGRPRGGGEDSNAHIEVLNALLTEMDGFRNESRERVFVMAATNFDVSGQGNRTLDNALVRRFDRTILVELPNKEQRQQFLQMKVDGNPALAISNRKIDNLAVRSSGMSLALLDSVLDLALRHALRKKLSDVTDDVVEEAFESFKSGRKRKWNPEQMLRTARHEAGHAVISWLNGEMPVYLTIASRSNYGGYMQLEQEEKGVWTKKEMMGRIQTALGGRAAEIVYYGHENGLSTGVSGDLETATQLAEYMICDCGMDEEAGLAVLRGRGDLFDGMDVSLHSRINDILSSELKKAIDSIQAYRPLIDRLAEILVKESHIDETQIRHIFEGQV